MSDINAYFLDGYTYVMPFRVRKTLGDCLTIEELGLINTRQPFIKEGRSYFYTNIKIITPFRYE